MNRILVIDDEEDYHKILKILLVPEGYEVFSSFDGEEGIKKAAELLPDLIVLDVNMPKKSGWEVCDAIRKEENTKKIPILMLTVRNKDEEQVYGLDLGSDDYLVKPFEPEVLVARINSLLSRVSQLRKTAPTL